MRVHNVTSVSPIRLGSSSVKADGPAAQPTLTCTPTSGLWGTVITLDGSNFTSGGTITALEYGAVNITSVVGGPISINSDGTWTVDFDTTGMTPVDAVAIEAVDSAGLIGFTSFWSIRPPDSGLVLIGSGSELEIPVSQYEITPVPFKDSYFGTLDIHTNEMPWNAFDGEYNPAWQSYVQLYQINPTTYEITLSPRVIVPDFLGEKLFVYTGTGGSCSLTATTQVWQTGSHNGDDGSHPGPNYVGFTVITRSGSTLTVHPFQNQPDFGGYAFNGIVNAPIIRLDDTHFMCPMSRSDTSPGGGFDHTYIFSVDPSTGTITQTSRTDGVYLAAFGILDSSHVLAQDYGNSFTGILDVYSFTFGGGFTFVGSYSATDLNTSFINMAGLSSSGSKFIIGSFDLSHHKITPFQWTGGASFNRGTTVDLGTTNSFYNGLQVTTAGAAGGWFAGGADSGGVPDHWVIFNTVFSGFNTVFEVRSYSQSGVTLTPERPLSDLSAEPVVNFGASYPGIHPGNIAVFSYVNNTQQIILGCVQG